MIGKELVCQDCGYVGKPKSITKGSFFLEVVLWLCFLLPGILYSAWRLNSRYEGCPECGGKMISVNSMVGKRIMRELEETK